LQEWIEEVAKIIFKDEPEKAVGATAKIFPFGSFKLGVMSPTSDIDCLCVVPKYIDRHEHFFGDLYTILEENNHVSDLMKAEYIYCPLMKMTFWSVDIDLTFAKIDRHEIGQIQETDLLKDDILKGLDEKSKISINGQRMNERML